MVCQGASNGFRWLQEVSGEFRGVLGAFQQISRSLKKFKGISRGFEAFYMRFRSFFNVFQGLSKDLRRFWSGVLNRFRGLKLQGVSEGLSHGRSMGISEESHGLQTF